MVNIFCILWLSNFLPLWRSNRYENGLCMLCSDENYPIDFRQIHIWLDVFWQKKKIFTWQNFFGGMQKTHPNWLVCQVINQGRLLLHFNCSFPIYLNIYMKIYLIPNWKNVFEFFRLFRKLDEILIQYSLKKRYQKIVLLHKKKQLNN